jgi:nucleoside-diphosphate-sugar epimerase
MQKIVVTGGAGFIGSTMTDRLVQEGHHVVVIDNLSTGKPENINDHAEFHRKDLAEIDVDELVKIFNGAKYVFHFAALARVQPSIEDPITFNEANVQGTLKVLLAAHRANVTRVIYSASSSAYGDAIEFPTPETHGVNPLSPYGLQKLIGEQYCKMFSEVYGLDTVSLRYFNVYGERMSLEGAYCLVMGIFAKQLLNKQPLTITNDGNQRRDFTYVDDVIEANWLAATYPDPLNGEVFNIGNGYNYSVNEVADMMGGEKTYGYPRIEPFETLADNTKAKNILGWNPNGDLPTWISKYKKDLGL